jgi:4'-phosphopantetheinyl transferase
LSGSAGVELWLASPCSTGAIAELLGNTLAESEKERADRFLRPEDRALSIVTRGSLRCLLSEATGIAPDKILLAEGPFGKPYLCGLRGPHFNVSHSGSFALIGLSDSRPIGVDIERIRVTGDELNVARSYFSATEYRALQGLWKDARLSSFFKIWTCKEAVLKACGAGISEHLKDFSVELTTDGFAVHPEPHWFAPALASVSAKPVEVPPGYVGCYALA